MFTEKNKLRMKHPIYEAILLMGYQANYLISLSRDQFFAETKIDVQIPLQHSAFPFMTRLLNNSPIQSNFILL